MAAMMAALEAQALATTALARLTKQAAFGAIGYKAAASMATVSSTNTNGISTRLASRAMGVTSPK